MAARWIGITLGDARKTPKAAVKREPRAFREANLAVIGGYMGRERKDHIEAEMEGLGGKVKKLGAAIKLIHRRFGRNILLDVM